MMISKHEESLIKNEELPSVWRSEEALSDLETFLEYNWEQRKLFFQDDKNTKQQFLTFLSHNNVRTNQYIGTIMFNGEQLNIYPKVYKSLGDTMDFKHLMQNLIWWLSYCKKAEYPFISIESASEESTNIKDLLETLYINIVKSEIDNGLYYQYEDETNTSKFIKGRPDLVDYYLHQLPRGNINAVKCTYSEYKCNNRVNQIIKYTCRLIFPSASRKNKNKLNIILARYSEVDDIKCTPYDCDTVHINEIHNKYRYIINLSKLLLSNASSSTNDGNMSNYCFLFPADALFEGFIGGFIKELVKEYKGKTHLQKSDMSLINNIAYNGVKLNQTAFVMKHDIFIEINDVTYILDTKYKTIPRFGNCKDINQFGQMLTKAISQNDLYQICEYARKRKVLDVFLLYPMYMNEEPELSYPIAYSEGDGKTINIHFIRLPFIYQNSKEKTEEDLREILKKELKLM